MAVLELEPEQLGELVALEGDSETIETQLRLLPPSQKILILPALQSAFPQDVELDNDTFNARAFIRDVHTNFTERTETAREFLRSSTTTQPRLAFINGGSVSARAACISRICAKMTNGDMKEAESIFNEIAKDGVAGLMKQDVAEEDKAAMAEDDADAKVEEGMEDPSARAMKAADSLDRETEGLQPEDLARSSTPGLEKAAESHATGPAPRGWTRSRLPKRSQASDTPSKAVFTNTKGDDIVRTVLTVPSRIKTFTVEEKRSTFGPHFSISTPTTASTMGPVQAQEEICNDEDCEDVGYASPGDESLFSVPMTPAVVYEAFLVDVQSSSPKKSVKRAQSVDRFYPSNSKSPISSPSSMQLKHTISDYHLRKPTSYLERNNSFQTLPRTTFVKASQTTIKKSPTLSSSIRSNSWPTQGSPRRVYVDKGEDAFEVEEEKPAEPFEPVFPIVEDLIIHLVDNNANEILESVIRSYKDGSYPIIPTPVTSPQDTPEKDLESPVSTSSEHHEKVLRPESYLTAETDDTGYHRRGEYDPYDADSYPPGSKRQWPPMPAIPTSVRFDSLDSSVEPPTPTLTPPPQARGVAEKFINFSSSNNAIDVQNALRQLLNLHFPASENGYSQYLYPVAPEAERLWKPVFKNDQNSSTGNDARNFDQILALGYEDGVKKDFFFQISGQVERLGTKRNGVNRSGKLDIRYLIANVMQHVSSFSTQSSFNPLSNPQVLAALLVPQIESYLAINTSTRLLVLQYPASHLPTVFALRNFLGSDLLKIAGVLDSLASEPPSMSRPRTANPLSNEAVSQRARSNSRLSSLQKSNSDTTRADSLTTLNRQTSSAGSVRSSLAKASASFAKADYLLPSAATDTEITTFLSSIWKCLIEKSIFYTPEPEPKPIIVERPPMPPTPTGSSRDIRRDRLERERDRHGDRDDTDRDSTYRPPSSRQAGSQSKISRLTGGSATSHPIPRSIYATSIISTSTARPSTRYRDRDTDYEPSITSTHTNTNKRHKYAASIASTKTTASEKERRMDREWENFYIGDEDSEDDAFDRMIMGRAGQRIVPEPEIGQVVKRDKRKALKWLGLA
ncbi:hypothetical protein BDZ45DRAFT_34762 [Acephala macrosclerotiorum]|nr:hypothetical protein BDZ45DRAFT_34762 [Acephala macrosclerotiorum]